MEITSKSVFIVTGGSSGIGAATAVLLGTYGATVVLAARSVAHMETIAERIPHASVVKTDMTSPTAIAHLIQETERMYGRIDGLVNNAGRGFHTPIQNITLVDFQSIMELNVYGPLLAMQGVLPIMQKQRGGTIINIGSGTTRMIPKGVGGYAASKAAFNMLSQAARAEFAEFGINVSFIYPFITATEFHHNLLRSDSSPMRGDYMPTAHTAEFVAEYIVHCIFSGETEIALTPASPSVTLPSPS